MTQNQQLAPQSRRRPRPRKRVAMPWLRRRIKHHFNEAANMFYHKTNLVMITLIAAWAAPSRARSDDTAALWKHVAEIRRMESAGISSVEVTFDHVLKYQTD